MSIQHFKDSPNTVAALKKAELDWEVEVRDVKVPGASSGTDCFQAIVRKDNSHVLSIMKQRYVPIQNSEVFSICDDLISGSNRISSAGCYFDGRKSFVQVELPDLQFDVVKNDTVQPYLTLLTSHDGSGTKGFYTATRLACFNQMSSAMSTGTHSFSIHHTRNASMRLAKARAMIESASLSFEAMRDRCKSLQKMKINKSRVGEFVNELFPVKFTDDEKKNVRKSRMRDQLLDLIQTGRGTDIPGVKGTGWGLFNAATELFDHHSTIRNGMEPEVRSLFYGGDQFRSKVLKAIEVVAA